MRLAKPCFDKYHRCPGWAGSGWKSAASQTCPGGYINVLDSQGNIRLLWKWRFHRCNKCNIVVWPWMIRYLSFETWKYNIQSWWNNAHY